MSNTAINTGLQNTSAPTQNDLPELAQFIQDSSEIFFGYAYHRTGSMGLARQLVQEVYLDVVAKAASFWWARHVRIAMLFDRMDQILEKTAAAEADLDRVYIPTLTWFSAKEREEMSGLHDAIWTLPLREQKLIILSLLLAVPNDRIAFILGENPDRIQQEIKNACDKLVQTWNPSENVRSQLGSLVFEPSLSQDDLQALMLVVMETTTARKFRSLQWVIIAGVFAVVSNVVVASVLAFAVVNEPPTSLKGVRTQVASLDAILLEREDSMQRIEGTLTPEREEARKVAAYITSKRLTNYGLSTALDALQEEQKVEVKTQRMIKVLKRASVALEALFAFVSSLF